MRKRVYENTSNTVAQCATGDMNTSNTVAQCARGYMNTSNTVAQCARGDVNNCNTAAVYTVLVRTNNRNNKHMVTAEEPPKAR